MSKLFSYYYCAVYGIALCFGSLAIAYFYFQLYLGLPPCPLCIIDRIVIALLGLMFILSLFWRGLVLRLLSWLLLVGLVVGARHVWLERFSASDEHTSCLPQTATQSIIDWLTSAFIGTSNCSIVYWQFLGLSIADLTFILYMVLLILIFKMHFSKPNYQRNLFT